MPNGASLACCCEWPYMGKKLNQLLKEGLAKNANKIQKHNEPVSARALLWLRVPFFFYSGNGRHPQTSCNKTKRSKHIYAFNIQ